MDISSISKLATPQTIDTLSGGLDAVSEGIQANPAGIAGLDDAIQSFSPAGVDPSTIDPASVPAAQPGDVAPPLDYMKLSPSGGQSLVSQQDVMQALQDPTFDVGSAISDCGNNMFSGDGIVGNIMGDNGPFSEALGGVQLPPPNDPAVSSQPNTNRGIIIVDYQAPTEDGGERGVVTDLKSNPLTSPSDPVMDDDPGKSSIKITPTVIDSELNAGAPTADDDPGKSSIKITPTVINYQDVAGSQSAPPSFAGLMSNVQTLDPFSDQGQATLQTLHDQLQTFDNMQSTVQDQIRMQQQLKNSM